MKTKYLLVAAVALFSATTSCDITDTIPKDAITDLNYWKKVDDLKLYANYFYTSLSGPSNSLDDISDNCVTNSPSSWLFNTATVPGSGGGWSTDNWANIRKLNYFMTHYQTVQGNAADINHYVAEIRFFRAWEYFSKVKDFGDVPWIDKDLTPTDDALLYKARDPRKVVVDKIVEDLEFAVANLKTPSNVPAGRLHRYAALQMLARVCLHEGTWMKYRNIDGWKPYLEKAVAASDRIMKEGGYAIVKGDTPNIITGNPLYYRQQFIQEDLTTNKECVLPRIYLKDLNMHNLSRSASETGVGVSKDFVEDFLCTDGLPIALSPLYKGDDSLQMEITNRDPRFRNMLDNKKLPFYLDGTKPISYPVTAVTVNKCPTGYMTAKFRNPEPSQNEANQSTYDWYIFRYAEVLLIYAEAKEELGELKQEDLDKSINLLRARLDEPGNPMGRLSINPPKDPNSVVNGKPKYGYPISPMLYEIRRERRIELAFEGFRWDDICRWKAGVVIENPKTMLGIAVNPGVVELYKKFNGGTDQFAGRALYSFTDWDGKQKSLLKVYTNINRTWNDKLYLNPLPKDQLTLNPKLTQNPGW